MTAPPSSQPIPELPSNPVFTYRAGFRDWAGAVQRVLVRSGILLLVLAPGCLCWGRVGLELALWLAGLGAGVLGTGLGWGWAWRYMLRRSFRKTFGPNI